MGRKRKGQEKEGDLVWVRVSSLRWPGLLPHRQLPGPLFQSSVGPSTPSKLKLEEAPHTVNFCAATVLMKASGGSWWHSHGNRHTSPS